MKSLLLEQCLVLLLILLLLHPCALSQTTARMGHAFDRDEADEN